MTLLFVAKVHVHVRYHSRNYNRPICTYTCDFNFYVLLEHFVKQNYAGNEGHNSKQHTSIEDDLHAIFWYSETCVKRSLKNRQNKDLNDNW